MRFGSFSHKLLVGLINVLFLFTIVSIFRKDRVLPGRVHLTTVLSIRHPYIPDEPPCTAPRHLYTSVSIASFICTTDTIISVSNRVYFFSRFSYSTLLRWCNSIARWLQNTGSSMGSDSVEHASETIGYGRFYIGRRLQFVVECRLRSADSGE